MKGLMNSMSFTELLTRDERILAERLSEIEKEDADRCANCGGEDCVCCEYYYDRQKWRSPEELFDDDRSLEDEYYADKYGEDEND